MNLSVLRRTAAEIAALAVSELYPDIRLIGGGETSVGFFYDFYFPHPIHIEIIEEKMRQIVREKRPIRTIEMVAFSAKEMLKKGGVFTRFQDLEGLVELIQIGEFADLSQGPHLKNTAELAAFKLQAEQLEEKQVRLFGWCHRSKEELKKFLKLIDRYLEPKVMGEKRGLWKGDVWLGPGIKMRQQLVDFLKEKWFPGALELSAPFGVDRTTIHRTMKARKVAEVWVEPPQKTHIQISFFDQTEEEFISSLQLIAKTLTILGFDHSHISKENGVGYEVLDGLDRPQHLVEVKKISGGFYISFEVEKIIEQMLEKNLVMLENQ